MSPNDVEDGFDEDFYEPGPVSIEVAPEGIFAVCEIVVGSDRGTTADYLAWLGPAARRHDCRVADVRVLNEYRQEDDFTDLPLPDSELDALREEADRRPKYLEVRVSPIELAGSPRVQSSSTRSKPCVRCRRVHSLR